MSFFEKKNQRSFLFYLFLEQLNTIILYFSQNNSGVRSPPNKDYTLKRHRRQNIKILLVRSLCLSVGAKW
jgi:hypothetical protein